MQLELNNEQAAFLLRVLNDYKDECEKCNCNTCEYDVVATREIAIKLINTMPFAPEKQ